MRYRAQEGGKKAVAEERHLSTVVPRPAWGHQEGREGGAGTANGVRPKPWAQHNLRVNRFENTTNNGKPDEGQE